MFCFNPKSPCLSTSETSCGIFIQKVRYNNLEHQKYCKKKNRHIYEILEEAKVIYGLKEQQSDGWGAWGLTGKGHWDLSGVTEMSNILSENVTVT